MPSRAYTSFLRKNRLQLQITFQGVNALSGLYLISTLNLRVRSLQLLQSCQCPLGLIPHFYKIVVFIIGVLLVFVSMPSRAYTSFLPRLKISKSQYAKLCQCPLGLIPHFYGTPSKTQVLCGFQSLFLQPFVRIFWQQPFSVHVNILDIFNEVYLPLTLN